VGWNFVGMNGVLSAGEGSKWRTELSNRAEEENEAASAAGEVGRGARGGVRRFAYAALPVRSSGIV